MQREVKFSLDYSLNRENAAEALILRHRDKNRTKNIVHAVILSTLAILFLVNLFFRFDIMSVILIAVCLLGLVGVFLTPKSQARAMAEKFENGIDFKLEIFSDGISITSKEKVSEIDFEKLEVCAENEKYFYFEANKRMFPLPKDAIDNENLGEISAFLAENLQKRYKNYSKN